MGFEREPNRFNNDARPYFPFLRQLPELLADQERRAKEPRGGRSRSAGATPRRGSPP